MTTKPDRLETEANLWFAATRSDGRPHLTPIWFVWVNEKIWLCTQKQAVKARIVASRPSVSFALEDGNRPVTAEGTARLIEIQAAPLEVHARFQTKYTWDVNDDNENVFIEISINKWLEPSNTE